MCIYGGESTPQQLKPIEKKNVDILSATPGRLIEAIDRQKITLTKEETKAASFYRKKGAKPSKEEIAQLRQTKLQSAEAAKYKLKDKFKEKYLKKTWVR